MGDACGREDGLKNRKHSWGIVSAWDTFCFFQHGLGKHRVASGGVLDQYMGHCAHQFSVLEDRRTGHALNNAAGNGQQRFIRHPDHHVFVYILGGVGYFFNLNGV